MTSADQLAEQQASWTKKKEEAEAKYNQAIQVQNIAKEEFLLAAGALKGLQELIDDQETGEVTS